MAFTGSPLDSTYLTNQEAANRDNSKRNDPQHIKIHRFPQYTHAAAQGAGTGEINLGKLPPGELTIYPDLSRVVTSAFAANADIHLGHRAYTQPDGTVVAEDDNQWLDNGDAASGVDAAFGLPAVGYDVVDSVGGIEVFAMIDTGNIEVGDTIDVWFAYTSTT